MKIKTPFLGGVICSALVFMAGCGKPDVSAINPKAAQNSAIDISQQAAESESALGSIASRPEPPITAVEGALPNPALKTADEEAVIPTNLNATLGGRWGITYRQDGKQSPGKSP